MDRIEKIQNFCLDFLEHLEDKEFMHLELSRHATSNPLRRLEKRETAIGYARIFAIAALIMELLVTKKRLSLRDVYYTLKDLFQNQVECNDCILDLGSILNLRRHEMNIIPASKGFVAGLISFRFLTKETLQSQITDFYPLWSDCSLLSTSDGVYINSHWLGAKDEEIEMVVPDRVKFIIVIEKEGIFRRLCEDQFVNRVPCILVTGCGESNQRVKSLCCDTRS
jgi:meiotic recombination protein SPO11